jgi:hypothetical protein
MAGLVKGPAIVLAQFAGDAEPFNAFPSIYGYSSWAALEWECWLKHPEDGAREGAEFIKHHIIRVAEKAFDDFAGGAVDKKQIERALGLR